MDRLSVTGRQIGGTSTLSSRWLDAIWLVVLAAVGFAFQPDNALVVRPLPGIALAGYWLRGKRILPTLVAGPWLGATLGGTSPWTAGVLAAALLVGVLAAGALLAKLGKFDPSLAEVSDVLSLAAFGAAPVAIASYSAASFLLGLDWFNSLLWLASVGLGVLVVFPLAFRFRDIRWTRSALIEFGATLIVLASASSLAFAWGVFGPVGAVGSRFLTFPPLIWLALRFGGFGVSWGTALLAVMITGWDHSPTSAEAEYGWAGGFLSSMHLAVVALTGHLLAAVATGRRKSETRLRVSEERLRKAAEISHLGHWEYDVARQAFEWTSIADRVFGHRPTNVEPTLNWFLGRLLPEEAASIEMQFADALSSRKSFETVFSFVRPDGEKGTAVLKGSPELDPAGRVLRLSGSVQDVTDARKSAEELLASREQLSSILGSMSDGVLSTKPDLTELLHANEAVATIFGVPMQTLFEQPGLVMSSVVAEDEGQARALVAEAREDGRSAGTIRIRPSNGEVRWIRAQIRRVCGYTGEAIRLDFLLSDITDQVVATEALQRSEARYRRLFETMNQGVIYSNSDDFVLSANPAACEILGVPEDQLVGKRLFDALRPIREDRTPLSEEDLPAYGLQSEEPNARTVLAGVFNRRERNHRWVLISAYLDEGYAGSEAKQIHTSFTDITNLKQARDELREMALYDTLTSLPNLKLFGDRIQSAIQMAERHKHHLGVLFVDLDRFKQVNDVHGHPVGDLLLKAVGQRLTAAVRRTDTVARLGGDEFVVLLPRIADRDDIQIVSSKLIEAFHEPFDLGDVTVSCTCSIGSSVYPSDGMEPEHLLAKADEAMYRAKTLGRYRTERAEPTGLDKTLAGLALDSQLREAIERDQLDVHYQPIVWLDTFELAGAEALVRWHHPEKGLLAAAEFVGHAERTGLVLPMGEWVARRAFQEAREWLAGRPGFRLAINVSPKQVLQADFASSLEMLLQKTGFPASALDIEITESHALETYRDAEHALWVIKELGARVLLDDLGVGHSSLSNLMVLPIDAVKIDRCFVQRLGDDPKGGEILAAIFDMVHRLGLVAIAEGVETEEQMRLLKGLGCQAIQGYAIARPLPASEFRRFTEAGPSLRNGSAP